MSRNVEECQSAFVNDDLYAKYKMSSRIIPSHIQTVRRRRGTRTPTHSIRPHPVDSLTSRLKASLALVLCGSIHLMRSRSDRFVRNTLNTESLSEPANRARSSLAGTYASTAGLY